jgi:hypothetical protein
MTIVWPMNSASDKGDDRILTNQQVWFITGAGGGMGADFAKQRAATSSRTRGLDGIAAGRSRAVRHHHHRRQPRVLSHGAPHGTIHELRGPSIKDAGADAIATAEGKIADLRAQIEAHRDLSTSLAFD